MQLVLPARSHLLLSTRMFQTYRWNLVSIIILVAHEYRNSDLWLDFRKTAKLSHWVCSILLAQLIATLIHYPFTVPLPGLSDWSAFLYRASFADLVISWLRQLHPWRELHGRYRSEIDPSGSETCFRPFKQVWAYGWHFLDS